MTKPLPSINLRNLVRQVITEQRHSYILESPRTLEEGVYDPAILKAIFTAGGPGSGKSFTADAIFGARGPKGKPYFENASFLGGGLKYINSDRFFEKELEKAGIDPGDLAKIEKEDPELWDMLTTDTPNNLKHGDEVIDSESDGEELDASKEKIHPKGIPKPSVLYNVHGPDVDVDKIIEVAPAEGQVI